MIGKVKTQNIKAVILDVDGVIVGKKIGVNSPYPSKKIIEKLKAVSLSGIPIHLCTAKPYFAIEKIVKDAGLFASHIVEGGAGIYDAKEGKFIERHPIPIDEAKGVFKKLLVKSTQRFTMVKIIMLIVLGTSQFKTGIHMYFKNLLFRLKIF